MQQFDKFYNLNIFSNEVNNMLKQLHNEKKWFEMGNLLLDIVLKSNYSNSTYLKDYIVLLISSHSINFDPVVVVQICNEIANSLLTDVEEGIKFIGLAKERFPNDLNAFLLADIFISQKYLNNNKLEESKKIIDDLSSRMRKLRSIPRVIYFEFFNLKSEYYYLTSDYKLFYTTKLKYFGFLSTEELKSGKIVNDLKRLAKICLISEDLFNFGELVI